MHTAAAAAANAAHAAAPAVGAGVPLYMKTAWSYSRSCFSFDNEMRFDRFTAGYEFANTQMDMYRNDITTLTELTVRKMSVYTVVGTMGMAIMIAIFCAGRLGLHGPSPPVWMQSLFLTNSGAAFCFTGMGIWFAFHASWRAQSASVHLLTRKTRLMIPTMKQLDRARKYFSQWEHQKLRDLLRLPYVGDAVGWKYSAPVPDFEGGKEPRGRARSAPPAREPPAEGRAPCWFEEEYYQDRGGIPGSVGEVGLPEMKPPEHFRQFGKLQKEWFAYDCYARICMLYGFLSFYHAIAYYGLGQYAIELRSFYTIFSATWIVMLGHGLIIHFDIKQVDNSDRQDNLPYCQFLGPLTIIPASIAMALDFRVEYNPTCIVFTWVCIFITYVMQIIYGLRLVELILPVSIKKTDDKLGNAWWPSNWRVPAAFQHVYYFVVPPQHLQYGQHDLVRETKVGGPNNTSIGDGPLVRTELLLEYLGSKSAQLPTHMQEKLTSLSGEFAEAASAGPKGDIDRIKHIASQLNYMKDQLGAQDDDDPGSGSGSGSDPEGNESIGVTGKAAGSYSKATPRMHAEEPDYVRFTYADPSRLLCILTSTFAFTWMFLIVAMFVDVLVGVQGLVTAPHWARPPMTRTSHVPYERGTPFGREIHGSGSLPWLPEELWWRENLAPKPTGWTPHWWQDQGHGAQSRRLGNNELQNDVFGSDQSRRKLQRALGYFFDSLRAHVKPSVPEWQAQSIQWPGFFEPRMIACRTSEEGHAPVVAAISARGLVAVVKDQLAGSTTSVPETFSLTGLTEYPSLVGASWSKYGIMLVSKAGHLLSCLGAHAPAHGQWACGRADGVPERVPIDHGGHLLAATSGWMTSSADGDLQFHVALVSKRMPDTVAMWSFDGRDWAQLGELRLPRTPQDAHFAKPSLAFVDTTDILVVSSGGQIIRRRLADGATLKPEPAAVSVSHAMHNPLQTHTAQWQDVCGVHGTGGMMHLSLQRLPSSRALQPQLITNHQS